MKPAVDVRVLVVDDSVVYRKAILDLLTGAPGVDVVGTAANGRIALQKCAQLRPDLLTLDIEMPEVDGLEVLSRLRDAHPPIGAILLSALDKESALTTLRALKLGAFDFVVKPDNRSWVANAKILRNELLTRIHAFGRSREIKNILARAPAPAPAATPMRAAPRSVVQTAAVTPQVVALGISTGGPQALGEMLPRLPAELAAPVLIVQHMPPLFTRLLAEALNEKCALRVCEAVDGEPVTRGVVYLAPGGLHLKVTGHPDDAVLRLTDDAPENSCRPAVDYLFRSVAEVYGPAALGVVMTGMGSDGTLGCRLLKRRGATVITQDAASCVIYGMPRAAAEEGLSDVIAPLNRIAEEITRRVGRAVKVCR